MDRSSIENTAILEHDYKNLVQNAYQFYRDEQYNLQNNSDNSNTKYQVWYEAHAQKLTNIYTKKSIDTSLQCAEYRKIMDAKYIIINSNKKINNAYEFLTYAELMFSDDWKDHSDIEVFLRFIYVQDKILTEIYDKCELLKNPSYSKNKLNNIIREIMNKCNKAKFYPLNLHEVVFNTVQLDGNFIELQDALDRDRFIDLIKFKLSLSQCPLVIIMAKKHNETLKSIKNQLSKIKIDKHFKYNISLISRMIQNYKEDVESGKYIKYVTEYIENLKFVIK